MLTRTDIYQGNQFPQDYDPATPKIITGRNVAHGRRTKAERAFVAADLHRGLLVLTAPTIGQAADLLRVSRTYVECAIKIGDEFDWRNTATFGVLNIVDAAKGANPPGESLAGHFLRSSPAEWLEAARMVGPGVIWDRMVSPLVT